MQSDLYSCEICCNPFDRTSCIPKIIPSCGHTLCSACLTEILDKNRACPFDTNCFPEEFKSLGNFTTNLILLQLVDQKLGGEYGLCHKHHKPKDFVCMDHVHQICDQCRGEHSGHTIKHIDDLKKEAQAKRKRLQSLVDDFARDKDETESFLRDSQKSIATKLTRNFDRIRETLHKKEKEMLFELESMFEIEKDRLRQLSEEFELTKDEIEAEISDLDSNLINKRFFKTLLRTSPGFDMKTEIIQLSASIEKIEKQSISAFEILTESKELIEKATLQMDNICTGIEEEVEEEAEEPALGLRVMQTEDIYDEMAIRRLLEINIEGQSLILSPRNILEESMNGSMQSFDFSLLKQVKIFQIELTDWNLTEESFLALKHLSAYCEKLTQLNLHFNHKNFSDTELLMFCSDPFWATDNIESLTLSLHYSDVSDTSMVKLVDILSCYIQNISSISLHLNGTKITDRSIKAFASDFIPKIRNLSQFVLGLRDTKISDSGIVELCKHLKPICFNITDFALGLSETNITDQCIITFSQEILSLLKNLEVFELYLYKTQITNDGIEIFCQNAKNSLSKLKVFLLSLNGTSITDNSASNLANVLPNMNALRKFRVDFGATEITDLGAQDVYTNLVQIVGNIEDLDLCFSGAKITNESISFLTKNVLPQMTALKDFKLNISRTQITNKAIEELYTGLKFIFANLQKFMLNFNETKVTGSSIEMILGLVDVSTMSNLTNFEIIYPQVKVKKQAKDKLDLIEQHLSLMNSK